MLKPKTFLLDVYLLTSKYQVLVGIAHILRIFFRGVLRFEISCFWFKWSYRRFFDNAAPAI